MTIKIGDKIPATSFTVMSETGPKPLTTQELFGGKKVVLFSVPGAFTPTCSAKHLPGFVNHADEIFSREFTGGTCTRYGKRHNYRNRIGPGGL